MSNDYKGWPERAIYHPLAWALWLGLACTVGNAMKKGKEVYHYRGQIERAGKRLFTYQWVEGWSKTTADGEIEYPWVTKAEARAMDPGCGCRFEREEP